MIKAIVTDVEGTTTSLSFVKDVLFPYARARLPEFVRAHRNDPLVRQFLDDTAKAAGRALDEDGAIAQLIEWIDQDKKITPLKALQGMIWERGYRHRDFTGHVYADAARNLAQWHARGLKLYVFSSGSVQAQKLIFGYSDCGDLTPLFSGYFDTAIGAKRKPASYAAISAAIGYPPAEILFLSDTKEELDAAHRAGMYTVQLVRDGALAVDAAHPQVKDFDALTALSLFERA
ncbi:MAG: 2,3-diketo-5-methylthio-1-phosphopentane phosphatase [Candidatus Muproteobacteria bacterium RBG_16_64_11]|uniref:Enolase-phosphatase E1 n=1 Tax=Candidatus Muproteobacteria bacterium RBG_16_64_11 TaxID=1817758 RepID=A0A1F6TEF5_9PROT|nr:MAG: 2,3-diketo-5-methylthio-1-phosphopentane phosphatase [Candidatus Muproteobacteria bacterium RBG_16_64_11]